MPPPRAGRSGMDHQKLVQAARLILEAIGEDPGREGLLETPERMARMYEEVFEGLKKDPELEVKTIFTEDYDEVVLVKDISFFSMCEHHLLPFTGKAHTAYLPAGKVLGLSKLARAVEVTGTRRPMLSHLRESGELEQVADLVIFIYREDYYIEDSDRQNIADVLVAKHRHGSTGNVSLYFRKELTQFRDLEIQRTELDY